MSDPIYLQSSMATARAVDGTFISYPFLEDGDTDTKAYSMACLQLADDYNAAQIPLDTPMSSAASAGVIDLPFAPDANAYFVGDTGHASVSGGMISFTRTFANIPQTTTVATGSEFYTFPGLRAPAYSSGSLKNITNISYVAGATGVDITIAGGTSSFLVGDNVHISMQYTIGLDPFIHTVVGNYRVLSKTTNTLRVNIGVYDFDATAITTATGTLMGADFNRIEQSVNVATQTKYEYILPGVTQGVDDITDVVVPKEFSAITVTDGERATSLTVATLPTYEEYKEMMDDEANIVIESSLSKWAGNILVLKTKTCKAR